MQLYEWLILCICNKRIAVLIYVNFKRRILDENTSDFWHTSNTEVRVDTNFDPNKPSFPVFFLIRIIFLGPVRQYGTFG